MKKLYYGGTILTMDSSAPRAEALLTDNGRITAVGSLEALTCPDAQSIDLQGATLLPGFVDGHSHMAGVGVHLQQNCELFECRSFADMLARIRRFRELRDLTHGEPIMARGYDPAILEENRHPTAAVLDSLGFDNPICCMHISGHVAVYNTVAMELAGVLSPDYAVPTGGFAGRNTDGSLSGYFEERAKHAFNAVFKSNITDAQLEQAILTAQDYYLRHGFTTVQDGSGNGRRRLECLLRLAEEGRLKLDTVAYMGCTAADVPMWEELLERHGRGYKGRLKLGGVKLFLDGSPQARTAWLRQPYEDSPDYCGYPTLTLEQTTDRIRRAVRYGLQPMAHCNGDAACEQFLTAWETVGQNIPLRPVMIHAQFVGDDQLDRMKECGMMASFFVGHCWYWGDTHLKNMGRRALRISPTAPALQRGIPFSLHQDSPVTPPDMLHSIWCAVNRITRSGAQLDKACALSVYDALIAATRGGAYTYFEEDTKGILKPGAAADFVILDKDPTAVDPMTIRDIRVLQTIKADVPLYTA